MKTRIVNVTIESFHSKTNLESKIIYSPHHHVHFFNSLESFFKDKPLFGHGSKSFRLLCDDPKFKETVKYETFNKGNSYYTEFSGCSTHPHNF